MSINYIIPQRANLDSIQIVGEKSLECQTSQTLIETPFLSPMVMIILRLKKYYSDSGEMNGGKNDGNGAVPVRLTDVNCIDPAI